MFGSWGNPGAKIAQVGTGTKTGQDEARIGQVMANLSQFGFDLEELGTILDSILELLGLIMKHVGVSWSIFHRLLTKIAMMTSYRKTQAFFNIS